MKKTIAGLALALPCAAFAGGAYDGIYSCAVTIPGETQQVYVTVNGQPDGRAIFAVAAAYPGQQLYGYGIGAISGGTFAGTTSTGGTFNMAINGTSMAGHVGILIGTAYNGTFVTASTNCLRIW